MESSNLGVSSYSGTDSDEPNPIVQNLTLYSINNATLSQWYSKRTKTQDKQMLERNITLAEPPMSSDIPVPPAHVRLPVTEGTPDHVRLPVTWRTPEPPEQQHTFTLPPYTVGTRGRVRRQVVFPAETPANPDSKFQRWPISVLHH